MSKTTTRQYLIEAEQEGASDKEMEWSQEIDDSLYCHYYGPCDKCKQRELDVRP